MHASDFVSRVCLGACVVCVFALEIGHLLRGSPVKDILDQPSGH
jgi:hypothetical protein